MKRYIINIILILIFFTPFASNGENNPYWQEPTKVQADSLRNFLHSGKNDTLRMYASRQLGLYYQEISRPVSLSYFGEQLRLARQLRQKLWEAEALSRIGYVSGLMQNYSGGLKSLLMAMEIASDPTYEREIRNVDLFSRTGDPHHARMTVLGCIHEHLGLLYYFTNDYQKAIEYYKKCLIINDQIQDDAFLSLIYLDIGESYFDLKQFDTAMTALNNALYYSEKSGYEKYKGLLYYDMGRIYEEALNYGEAKKFYHLGAQISIQQESSNYVGLAYRRLADLERKNGSIDSSLIFAARAVNIYRVMNDSVGLADAYLALSSAFDVNDQTDSAYYYMKEGIVLKSLLNKEDRVKKFQAVGFEEQIRLQALEAEQIRLQANIRTFSLLAAMVVLLFISGLIYRNNRQQKRSKAEIEKAYTELKATQTQLIHSEKMASLGELTAGIAHEIQNPLNFVNNFSEVSIELVDELKHESEVRSQKSEVSGQQAANGILDDIKQNLEKILHHGKRADAIVKGMLQHSRASSGQKEPTDINALADEYLRLAYHGLRAKDKSFNADFRLEADESLPKVNVVPQDIGRVLLNLINNAFYAVDQKKKQLAEDLSDLTTLTGQDNYKPTVTLITKHSLSLQGESLSRSIGSRGEVLISVKDNGNGIPEEIKDKIFQPFFTTKPTGQGTGLGLSMSYDIITKGHGGELSVETKEKEGTGFIIRIPC